MRIQSNRRQNIADLDAPETVALHREAIWQKASLRRIYEEWYQLVSSEVTVNGRVLEIGSGAGFLSHTFPGLIRSDLVSDGVDVVLNGQSLPFCDSSLDSIVMTNVFHHLSDSRAFLSEATRCLKPGGTVAMIEPWATPWSSIAYRLVGHEPFDVNAPDWTFEGTGRLSSSNQALPWIVFKRDLVEFERTFASLRVEKIRPIMPWSYIATGGLSRSPLLPFWAFRVLRRLERTFRFLDHYLGMFALVTLTKTKREPDHT